MIKVLIVDDSAFVREQLRRLLLGVSDFLIVGEAINGKLAVEMTQRLRPDVIIMDVDMPVEDGIEATRRIMEDTPTPILIHTSSFISRARNVPFEAIKNGALDIIEKPSVYPFDSAGEKELTNRIRLLAGIKVFRRMKTKSEETKADTQIQHTAHAPHVLAIAASTGGPRALYDFFGMLPPFIPFPILLVQHIGANFVLGFIEWLQNTTKIQMKIAQDAEQLLPNVCYVSPGGIHLSLRANGAIHLDDSPAVHSCKPSADILFKGVSTAFGRNAVGIVLTGIGDDGALGLLQMKSSGAITIAQDEESSVVFGMPKKASDIGAVSIVGNIPQIADHVKKLFRLS